MYMHGMLGDGDNGDGSTSPGFSWQDSINNLLKTYVAVEGTQAQVDIAKARGSSPYPLSPAPFNPGSGYSPFPTLGYGGGGTGLLLGVAAIAGIALAMRSKK